MNIENSEAQTESNAKKRSIFTNKLDKIIVGACGVALVAFITYTVKTWPDDTDELDYDEED